MVSPKLPAPIGQERYQNTMENPFLKMFCNKNAPPKIFRIEIWTFLFQICFQNPFRTSGSGQTENTPVTPIGVFSVWPLPEVRNWFQKQISNENVHISILIFLGGALRSSQIFVKNWFSIVFWNLRFKDTQRVI